MRLPTVAKRELGKIPQAEVLTNELASVALNLCAHRQLSGTCAQAIGIVSCDMRAGSSTIAMQLARGVASVSQEQVLLVDGNLESPRIAHEFGIAASPGLGDVLTARAELPDCLRETERDNLVVLTSGSPIDARDTTVQLSAAQSLTAQLKDKFDFVIVDLPPIGQTQHVLKMCAVMDGVILVVEAERTHVDQVQHAIGQLTATSANVLGIVLNKERQHVPRWLRRWLGGASHASLANGR